jgi:hypothetical protein
MFLSRHAWRYAYANAYCHHHHSRHTEHDADPGRGQHAYTWADGPLFGVRRPLRHLAWRLSLSEAQVREMVDVLDRLKTAYGQAKLDRDRATSDVAQAFGQSAFDAERIAKALDGRLNATQGLNAELASALARIFAILDEKQRGEFAYLLRSGSFTL